eukprot:g20444.t1
MFSVCGWAGGFDKEPHQCLHILTSALIFTTKLNHNELIIDFRKKGRGKTPIYINGVEVQRVKSVKFLRVTTTDKLPWNYHIDATVKTAQQHLFFL